MAKTAIRADFDEPLDAHRNFLAQIAFHQSFAFDDLANAVDFVFAKVLDLLHRINVRLIEYASCPRLPDPVDVRQRDKRPFVARKIDACNSCHIFASAAKAANSHSYITARLEVVPPKSLFNPDAVCAWNFRRSPALHPYGE